MTDHTLLTEGVEKLVRTDPRYVQDSLWDSADRFEEMSDNGTDSVYAEPARTWRTLASKVSSVQSGEKSVAEAMDDVNRDYWWIATGIIWYELNTR